MSWTKRQFVEQAFEEIGLASYVYDLQPDQLQSACRRLDTMMATWNAKGLRLGYPLPSTPEDTSLDDETNVPDRANEAIVLNLAVKLAPSFGKVVSPDTRAGAKNAMRVLYSYVAPIEMQLPDTLPSGAGNKPWRTSRDEYMPTPEDPIQAGGDSLLDLE